MEKNMENEMESWEYRDLRSLHTSNAQGNRTEENGSHSADCCGNRFLSFGDQNPHLAIMLFSRMRSRRVPVLKLGSRGPGGDARSLRLCSQSVRKASTKRPPQASAEGRTCRRVQNRRETQNCRHFLRFVSQKCQQSQGSGGSWSRNPELSSLLD